MRDLIDDYLLRGQRDRLKARTAKLQRWIARCPERETRADLRAPLVELQGALARAEDEIAERQRRREFP